MYGDNDPDYILALLAEEKNDFESARKFYTKAANADSGAAQHNLGVLSLEGKGGPQDYAEAAKWFRKAAEQGVPNSQANLGKQYVEGLGVPKDLGEALKWIRKSAEQHFADGEYKLGIMYFNGYGTEKNETEGYKWIERAAAQHHPLALDLQRKRQGAGGGLRYLPTNTPEQRKQAEAFIHMMAARERGQSGSSSQTGGSKQGCFIATAACGSADAPAVESLRGFRDNVLSKHLLGRAMIHAYETIAPPIASWVSKKPARRNAIRRLLVVPLAGFVERLSLSR